MVNAIRHENLSLWSIPAESLSAEIRTRLEAQKKHTVILATHKAASHRYILRNNGGMGIVQETDVMAFLLLKSPGVLLFYRSTVPSATHTAWELNAGYYEVLNLRERRGEMMHCLYCDFESPLLQALIEHNESAHARPTVTESNRPDPSGHFLARHIAAWVEYQGGQVNLDSESARLALAEHLARNWAQVMA